MPMENRAIMAFARTQLRERWGVAAATFLVYLVITCGLTAIPVLGWIGGYKYGGDAFCQSCQFFNQFKVWVAGHFYISDKQVIGVFF